MTYKLSSPGWFAELNGLKVLHHEIPASLDRTTWARGFPHRIDFHYQAGCGADLFNTQISRGFAIITFNVDQGGQWRQYMDARQAPWHLFDESRHGIGVEHAAMGPPTGGVCDLNDTQLEASARGFAAVIDWVEDAFGVTIPASHTNTCKGYQTIKAIGEHNDYPPCLPTTHIDGLYGWGWPRYLGRIEHWRGLQPIPAPPFPGKLLKLHTVDESVIRWKRRMSVKGFFKGENDGPHYGQVVEDATRAFQRKRKLAVDGVVGPITWKAAWT